MGTTRKKSDVKTTFKQLKRIASNSEHKALNMICKRNKLRPKQLKAGDHTETCFIFHLK